MKYHDEHRNKVIETYKKALEEMPSYVKRFFTFYEVTKNASANTILAYYYDLEIFFYYLTQECPVINTYNDITLEFLDSLVMQDIQEYLSFLTRYEKNGKIYSNTEVGRARKLASLRSFYRYYQVVEKSIKNNPASAMPVPKQPTKDVVALTQKEIKDLLSEVFDMTGFSEHQKAYMNKVHYRDVALITLLLGTGIRVSECVGIDLDDIDFNELGISIHRKGNKDTTVYFGEIVADALKDYLSLERKPKDMDEPALFVSSRGTRITVRSVERIVKKFSEKAIKTKKISTHKLRSTFASQLYRETKDLMQVRDTLGHANLSIVQRYVNNGEERKKMAGTAANKWL